MAANVIPLSERRRAESRLASHLNASAHEVNQAGNGKPAPLGWLNAVRFRIRVDLPKGFPVAGLTIRTRQVHLAMREQLRHFFESGEKSGTRGENSSHLCNQIRFNAIFTIVPRFVL